MQVDASLEINGAGIACEETENTELGNSHRLCVGLCAGVWVAVELLDDHQIGLVSHHHVLDAVLMTEKD